MSARLLSEPPAITVRLPQSDARALFRVLVHLLDSEQPLPLPAGCAVLAAAVQLSRSLAGVPS